MSGLVSIAVEEQREKLDMWPCSGDDLEILTFKTDKFVFGSKYVISQSLVKFIPFDS